MASSRLWGPVRRLLGGSPGRVSPLMTVRSVSSEGDRGEYIVTPREPSAPHPGGNYAEYILKDTQRWQDRVALECILTGSKTTYSELRDQVARWGGYLASQGVGRGDVVAVVGPNVNEYSPIALGTVAAGAVTTGINPTYTPSEMAFQLSDSATKLVVVFSPLEPVVRAALALLKKDLPLVAMGLPSSSGIPQAREIFQDSRIPLADSVEVSGSDPMALMYSSGTTGRPKGAILTHAGASSNIAMLTHPKYLLPNLDTTAEFQHAFLMLLPMFHVAGLLGVHAVGIQKGVRLVNYLKFDPANFLEVIQKYEITDLHVVPALLNFLVSHPGCTAETLKRVQAILCGTAPLADAALNALKEKVARPFIFQQAYGMTELLFATLDPIQEDKLGYTGRLLPGVQAKVLDLGDGVTTLPPNTDGEICIKSESQMAGYLNNEAATRETIDSEGWLHTGDVGHYDQDGYFKIVDRTKELIKVKSYQVSPSELEGVLLELPGVLEAAVVGVPHPRLGEAPRVYLVAKEPITQEKVSSFMATRLAPHKLPVGGVVLTDAIPRNATGKVLKKQLKEMALEEISKEQ